MKDIEIIGEAANRISAELRAAEPAVPWIEIIAMRNRLIHAYSDAEPQVVWETVGRHLPVLAQQLREILILRP